MTDAALAFHIPLLYVLNGAQGILVLIVLLRDLGRQRQLKAIEKDLEKLPETLKKHDDELVARTGREFYVQLGHVMADRAEGRAFGQRRASDVGGTKV